MKSFKVWERNQLMHYSVLYYRDDNFGQGNLSSISHVLGQQCATTPDLMESKQ